MSGGHLYNTRLIGTMASWASTWRSSMETFGMALQEAVASGTPVTPYSSGDSAKRRC